MPNSVTAQWLQDAKKCLKVSSRIILITAASTIRLSKALEFLNSESEPRLGDVTILISDSRLKQHYEMPRGNPDSIYSHPLLGVVRDEFHNSRNATGQGYAALQELCSNALFCCGLSATPTPTRLDNVVNVAAALRIPGFGSTSTGSNTDIESVRHRLEPHVLMRTLESVDDKGKKLVQLPELTVMFAKVQPTAVEREFQDTMPVNVSL